MRSRTATEIADARAARIAAMTPGARVRLAIRLSKEGLDTFMATHGLDRNNCSGPNQGDATAWTTSIATAIDR